MGICRLNTAICLLLSDAFPILVDLVTDSEGLAAMHINVACIQCTSGVSISENVTMLSNLVRGAQKDGAQFVHLPEACNLVQMDKAAALQELCTEEKDPVLQAMRNLAKELCIWILIGSLVLKKEEFVDIAAPYLYNRSFLLDDSGSVTASYDKMHMFDATVGGGESYRESDSFIRGNAPVIADTPWGPVGMSICYDLRFPAMYQCYAKAGTMMLSIPSAFTVPTGQAHWHILLRARAIETGCFVIAPAQVGHHPGGRITYGHSLIIDPWGVILAESMEDCAGWCLASCDLTAVAASQQKIPAILWNDTNHLVVERVRMKEKRTSDSESQ